MNASLENIKKTFDQSVTPRNPAAFLAFKRKIQLLLSRCPANGTLLDLGGGEGILTESFPSSIVADYCAHPLLSAVKNRRKVIQCDMHSLPAKDNAFSIVFLCHVLQHSPNPETVLQEARRVLARNGILILVLPNAAGAFQMYKLITSGQVKPLGNPPGKPTLQCHQYTLENTKEFLNKFHFKIVRSDGDFVSLPLLWKLKGWYALSSALAGARLPKLCDSLIFVAQCQKP